jgi:hypothetical protein
MLFTLAFLGVGIAVWVFAGRMLLSAGTSRAVAIVASLGS